MNYLLVATNPEEAIASIGGTIALLHGRGDVISVLIISDGITSKCESYDKALKLLDIDRYYDEFEKTYKSIGVRRVYFEGFPDNRLEETGYPLKIGRAHV